MDIREYEIKRALQLIEEDAKYKDDFITEDLFVCKYPKYEKKNEEIKE